MKPFEYKILRYLHDRITGEFVNVGLILYSKDDQVLLARTVKTYSRLSDFFRGIDGKNLKKLFSGIEFVSRNFSNQKLKRLNFDNITNLDSFISQILPIDDSSLFFSETKKGLAINFENTFDDLFSEIIIKYDTYHEQRSLSDAEVWRNVYRKYFDKYRITQKLIPHKIKTTIDEFEFDHCWKNGSWNIYKPISFDLADSKYIKEKIYKWDGIVRELESSKEPLSINFLAIPPKNAEAVALLNIIQTKLVSKGNEFTSKIIFEDQADNLAFEIQKQIENH